MRFFPEARRLTGRDTDASDLVNSLLLERLKKGVKRSAAPVRNLNEKGVRDLLTRPQVRVTLIG